METCLLQSASAPLIGLSFLSAFLLLLYVNEKSRRKKAEREQRKSQQAFSNQTLDLALHNEYAREIFDSQKSLLAFTDGTNILDANMPFLERFSSIDAFKKEGFLRLQKQFTDPQNNLPLNPEWLTQIKQNPDEIHRLTCQDDTHQWIYQIRIRELESTLVGKGILIALDDITELEHMKEEYGKMSALGSMGKLAGGLSHEMNTPLTSLKGNLEMLSLELDDLSCADSKEITTLTSEMSRSLTRLSTLTQSIRELASLEDQKEEKFSLAFSLWEAGRITHTRHGDKLSITLDDYPLDFEAAPSFTSHPITGSQIKTKQAWILLLDFAYNAYDSSKQQQLKVIDIHIQPSPSSYCVTISHHAGNMDPKRLQTLFEPFTYRQQHQGLGIELHLARTILEHQHVTLQASNSPDGVTFTVEIPSS